MLCIDAHAHLAIDFKNETKNVIDKNEKKKNKKMIISGIKSRVCIETRALK